MATRNVSLLRSTHINDLCSMLQEQIRAIEAMVGDIDSEHERLANLMIELESAGIIAATPQYQQGKYLYLIYPMRHGKREREYVGAAPTRRDEAETKIANYQKYRQHSEQLTALELQAEKLFESMTRVLLRHKFNQRNERSNAR